ncbi:hypothetical protein QD712_13425 [Streptomyces acidiscabies]|uniref:hypothetical protein n=1 Tax=Streptomyces acidiscabies TaxID=42234 RepID=UPI0030CEAA8A
MTNQTLIGLLTVAITAYLGYRLGETSAIRRHDRDLDVMRHQVEAHVRFTEQQFHVQREAERERYIQERMERSYEELGRWLHTLDRTIDEVWAGVHATDEEIQAKASLIVRAWPWETLRVPEHASGAQLYWSSEVRALNRKFAGASAGFVNRAASALKQNGDEGKSHDARSALWESFNEMHNILGEVRDQARCDLGIH